MSASRVTVGIRSRITGDTYIQRATVPESERGLISDADLVAVTRAAFNEEPGADLLVALICIPGGKS